MMTESKPTEETQQARDRRAWHHVRALSHHAEKVVERGADALWRSLKKKPMIGVSTAGLAGLGLASLIGASELAIGIAAAVAAYQILKKHEPPSKALEEAARFGL